MPTIPRAGREYVTATLTDAPVGAALEVSIDGGATWHPTTRDGDTIRFLVAGPDATDNPAGTIALPAGRSLVRVRLVDNPETVIRRAPDAIDIP